MKGHLHRSKATKPAAGKIGKVAKSSKGGGGGGGLARSSSGSGSRPASERQGGELPAVGSPISSYPPGSCVMASTGGDSRPAWFLISFKISGTCFLRRMTDPPSSARWNDRLGEPIAASSEMVSIAADWPNRGHHQLVRDDGRADVDPLELREARSAS